MEASFLRPRSTVTSRWYPFLVQSRVALPTIGVEQTSWLDAIPNEGMQARGRGVFNHPHPNPSNARTIGLGGYDDQDFSGFVHICCNGCWQ